MEGLLYAQKAGLDPLTVIDAVGGGAAGSFSLAAYGPRILKRGTAGCPVPQRVSGEVRRVVAVVVVAVVCVRWCVWM